MLKETTDDLDKELRPRNQNKVVVIWKLSFTIKVDKGFIF